MVGDPGAREIPGSRASQAKGRARAKVLRLHRLWLIWAIYRRERERERNFLPQPQGCGLCKLEWHVIQPVSKQGLKQSCLGLNLSSAYKLCDSGPVT